MARALDAAGLTLFGNPGWQFEGEDAGVGFAVGYIMGVGVPGQQLVARLGPVEARRSIHPQPDSVAAVEGGCASVPADDVPLVALSLLVLRRRRVTPVD